MNERSSSGLIRVENVKKSFDVAGQMVEVLHGVDFSIEEGTFAIIYGPSGSGKSTLLNVMTGLDAPTTGKVYFGGKDIYAAPPEERAHFRAGVLGMVYQTNYWIKSLTVLENVAVPLYFLGYSRNAAAKEALDSLGRINMAGYAHKYPSVLSGGEQQRVALARALVANPSYIVADEPTGNLDSKNGDMVMDILNYFQKELNRTIILVTHNLEYLAFGNQLLFIQDGLMRLTKDKDVRITTNKLLREMKERLDTIAEQHQGKRHHHAKI